MHTSPLKKISKYMGASFLMASIVWIILLVQASDHIRVSNVDHYNVSVGHLILTTMTRHHMQGSSTFTMAFGSGLVYYLLAWLGMGALLGLLHIRLSQKET